MEELEYLMKDKRRGDRRSADMHAARHRQRIDHKVHSSAWYKHLHQYSKGKIHCSCNLCRFRPTYDLDNKPMQDVRNILDMDQQLEEFKRYA